MTTILFISFLILLLLGVPVAFAMSIGSLIALLTVSNIPPMIIAQKMQYGIDSFPLLAVPFFILAGHLMNKGGLTIRIVDFAISFVGHISGGLAQVTVLASMVFAGISGSAIADASALGTILIPEMKKQGYSGGFSAGLLAAASTIGPIIPPSIIMVIYGITASQSVGRLFLGGIVPGILMGIYLMVVSYVISKRRGYPSLERASWGQRSKQTLNAIWAIIMPIIILGGILSGVCTPTEAAAIAVIYSVIVGMFIYKEITWKDILPICQEVFLQTAGILIIIAGTAVLGWLLTMDQIPAKLSVWLLSITSSKYVVLLLMNFVLLILGMFMESSPIVLLTTPIFLPIAISMGIDPIQLGLVMVLNICIGLITPPVGMCMFIACERAEISVKEFTKNAYPFFLALIAVLLMITFIPSLVTGLPNLVYGGH